MSMSQSLTVIPVPHVDLNGKIEFANIVVLSMAGIRGEMAITGEMTGKIGATEIKTEIKASDTGVADPPGSGSQAPGFVGLISTVLDTINGYVKGEALDRTDSVDRTAFTSSATLSQKFWIETEDLELKGKPSSPDLSLDLANYALGYELGVKGKLDILDLAASALLSPAGARAVQEARARAAGGKTVSASARADLILSCTGKVERINKTGISVTIDPSGNYRYTNGENSSNFEGSIKIQGSAEIELKAEAKVWVVTAQAGANGCLNTSWSWEFKSEPGKADTAQKRYYFEGLKVKAKAYAEVSIETDEEERGRNLPAGSSASASASATRDVAGAEADADLQVADVFDHVDKLITGSQNAMSGMTGFNPDNAEGTWYDIIRPTVEKVTENDPPWEKW